MGLERTGLDGIAVMGMCCRMGSRYTAGAPWVLYVLHSPIPGMGANWIA